jgi:hypothetical protein
MHSRTAAASGCASAQRNDLDVADLKMGGEVRQRVTQRPARILEQRRWVVKDDRALR